MIIKAWRSPSSIPATCLNWFILQEREGLLDHRTTTLDIRNARDGDGHFVEISIFTIHKKKREEEEKDGHFFFLSSYFIASERIPLRQQRMRQRNAAAFFLLKKQNKKKKTFGACARLRHRRRLNRPHFLTTSQEWGIMLFQPDSGVPWSRQSSYYTNGVRAPMQTFDPLRQQRFGWVGKHKEKVSLSVCAAPTVLPSPLHYCTVFYKKK